MKITVNERRVVETAKARKVLSPAELDRIAQDAARQVVGPKAKVKQVRANDFSDYKDMIAYSVVGTKLDRATAERIADLAQASRQSSNDLHAAEEYESEYGYVLKLYPATRRNLAVNAAYRLSRADIESWSARAPEGVDADTFLRQLVDKDCKEDRLHFGLTMEEVFELASPEDVARHLKSVEQTLAKKARRAGKTAKASNVGSRGDYVIEHVYNYGDDTIRGQTLKAADAYDALWKAAGAVKGNALINAKALFRSVAAMRHYPLHDVFNWLNDIASEDGAGYIMAVTGPDGEYILEDAAYDDGEYNHDASEPGCWSTESGSRKFYDLEGSFYDDVDDADKAEDED